VARRRPGKKGAWMGSLRQGIVLGLVVTLFAAPAASASRGSIARIGQDNNPNSLMPPELQSSPLYHLTAPSPCAGHGAVYHHETPDGLAATIEHQTMTGCSAPVSIQCMTSVADGHGMAHGRTANGSGYCNVNTTTPGWSPTGDPYLHNMRLTLTVSPPFFWQLDTTFCHKATPQTVLCSYTSPSVVGVNHTDYWN
jgi:hypothetical protein